MTIIDSHSRKVSFDAREELGDKIDKLTVMIGKLELETADQSDNLNHKFTKVEVEDKIEVTTTDAIMISRFIRINIGQIVEMEDSVDRTEVGLDMNKIIER